MHSRGEQPEKAELRVAVLTSFDELMGIEDEWARLHNDCARATPFQHPDWIVPWARHFASQAIFTVAIRSRGGALVGLAPWFRHEREGARVLGPLGGGHSDHHELLAHPAWEEAAVEALFATLGRLSREWSLCDLEQLSLTSPLMRRELPPGLIEHHRGESQPCPILRLPTASEPLSAVVPGHQLARFRKYRRRAERFGRLELLRADIDDHQATFSAFLALHTACWRARGELGMAADPVVRAFHAEVVARTARSGSLRLYVLRSGSREIASLYGFCNNNTLYCYWQGFDPEAAAVSPGMLLVGSVLEDAKAEGAVAVDFLRGAEEYKFRWGARSEKTYRRQIVSD